VKSESEVNCCVKREPMYSKRPHIYRQPSPPSPNQLSSKPSKPSISTSTPSTPSSTSTDVRNDQEPTGSKQASTNENQTKTKRRPSSKPRPEPSDQDQTSKHQTIQTPDADQHLQEDGSSCDDAEAGSLIEGGARPGETGATAMGGGPGRCE
jgi:hypothetical protein